jgi:hypothetical protein
LPGWAAERKLPHSGIFILTALLKRTALCKTWRGFVDVIGTAGIAIVVGFGAKPAIITAIHTTMALPTRMGPDCLSISVAGVVIITTIITGATGARVWSGAEMRRFLPKPSQRKWL